MSNSLNVVAIGSGNIASLLVPALQSINCTILQVFSRSISKARILSKKVNAKAISDLSKIDRNADLYIVMVKDDAISDVVSQLSNIPSNAIVVHTSGATSHEELSKVSPNYGVFYPLQSFTKNKPVDWNQVPFLLTANNTKTLRTINSLAKKLSKQVSIVNDLERLHYHLSAVYINNFTNHLACIADTILEQNNLDPKVLKPIMASTFEKIKAGKPCLNQTGPAARGDIKLQKRHLQLMKGQKQWQAIYKSISSSIQIQSNDNAHSK